MVAQNIDLQINRREVLNLAWLASLGFFLIPVSGVTVLFAFPRLREGEFGGQFVLGKVSDVFPQADGDPGVNFAGKFWLSRTADGSILAIYKVCTHLGCLYNWQPEEHKFICPCHGSEFELDGTYIRGPAPRSLDRLVIRLFDETGKEIAATGEEGFAIAEVNENWLVTVDTGSRIRGIPKFEKYPTSEKETQDKSTPEATESTIAA